MHYTKKFLRKETEVSLVQWFGPANLVATFYTLTMFIFVSIGALAGGVINDQTDFWAVLYTGFITGFAVDAGFNSDKNITQEITNVRKDTHELFNDTRDLFEKEGIHSERTSAQDDSLPETKTKRTRRALVNSSPAVPPKRIT